jgi:peroxiredoxin
MDGVSLSYLVLWAIVIAQGFALLLMFRSMGTVFLASREGISRDGLRIGSKAPVFTAYDASGAKSLTEFLGKWLVLVFAAPTCEICLSLLPGLERLQSDVADDVDVLILLRGDPSVAESYRQATRTTLPVLAIGDHGIAERYSVRVSPFVHVLDATGMIRAKGLVNTVENVAHQLYEAGLRGEQIGSHVPEPPAHTHVHEAERSAVG